MELVDVFFMWGLLMQWETQEMRKKIAFKDGSKMVAHEAMSLHRSKVPRNQWPLFKIHHEEAT